MTDDTKSAMTLPPQLLAASKERTAKVIAKVREAMKEMELDIQNSEGIYPFNGGRITVAEVCRRAKISNMTLQSHCDFVCHRRIVLRRQATIGRTPGFRSICHRVHKARLTAYSCEYLHPFQSKTATCSTAMLAITTRC